MIERQILFNAPMVRALLAGTKTQTRRIIEARKDYDIGCELAPCELAGEVNDGHYRNAPWQPGDRLWVREAWRIGSWDDGCGFWIDYCDGPRKERLECQDVDLAHRLIEQTGEDLRKCDFRPTNGTMYEWAPGQSPLRWRPSIHMPRWASRITLEVTGVRGERLRDISEADAIAEGVERHDDDGVTYYGPYGRSDARADRAFRALWESINGPDSWDVNPWVWAIEFKRIEP